MADVTGAGGFKTNIIKELLSKRFYFAMAALITAIIVFGFSRTIDRNLLHSPTPVLPIVYVHALVFSTWAVLYLVQNCLVAAAKVALHRRLGKFAAVVGALAPVVGVGTAIFNHIGDVEDAFISLPFDDMIGFTIAFSLAIRWRKRPEYHRRLMLVAMCALTGAAFARFPASIVPESCFYIFADGLLVLGVLRDLIVNKSVHIVYRYALPASIAGHAIAMYLFLAQPPFWMAFVRFLLG
jgi:hypothetical protein